MNVKKEMVNNPSGKDYLLTTTSFQTAKGSNVTIKTERFDGKVSSIKGEIAQVPIFIDTLYGDPGIEYPYYIHIEGEANGVKHPLYRTYKDAMKALSAFFSEVAESKIVKSLRQFEKEQSFDTIMIK